MKGKVVFVGKPKEDRRKS